MPAPAQTLTLMTTVCAVLLSLAVVLFLQRSTPADGRIARPALILLGLLTLTLLLDPLWSALGSLLAMTVTSPGFLGGVTSLSTVVFVMQLLLVLALGALALLSAVRTAPAPHLVRVPGSPRFLAGSLCALALLALVLLPLSLVMSRLVADGHAIFSVVSGAVTLLAGLARALVIPVGALLIARTTGRPRRLTWIALAALWAGTIAADLAIRALVVQLALGAGPEAFPLWNGVATAVQATGALTAVVLAGVVLAQLRGTAHSAPHTARTP